MLELFVSGLDDKKYYITAGLAATMQSLGYSTGVYKPVQVGAIERDGFIQSPDLAFVKSIDPYVKTYFSYLFKNSSMPLIAAEIEDKIIDKNTIYQDYKSISEECIITDGTMGLSTFISENFLEQDMVKMLDIPVLLVISPTENNIGNTITEINQAISSNVKLRGIIINNFPDEVKNINLKSVPKLIEKYTSAKILGIMPECNDIKKINPNELISNILTGIDLESVFGIKIEKLN